MGSSALSVVIPVSGMRLCETLAMLQIVFVGLTNHFLFFPTLVEMLTLNGYISIPPSHPFHGITYDELNFNVNRIENVRIEWPIEWTYSDICSESIFIATGDPQKDPGTWEAEMCILGMTFFDLPLAHVTPHFALPFQASRTIFLDSTRPTAVT